MFTVNSLGLSVLFCMITMLGWGSWANTQSSREKPSGRSTLLLGLCIGVFLSLVCMFTLGSTGGAGKGAIENLSPPRPANHRCCIAADLQISSISPVVAIDAAGMSVAFPLGVGPALAIGTLASYLQALKGNPAAHFSASQWSCWR